MLYRVANAFRGSFMPFKHAYLLVGLLLVVTVVGFWPTFFAKLDSVYAAFLAHGFTATAWVVLVGFQS